MVTRSMQVKCSPSFLRHGNVSLWSESDNWNSQQ